MADPAGVRPRGAPRGHNGEISNNVLGSIYVRVSRLQHGIVINSQESAAPQAKTFYPQRVSEAPFVLTVEHLSRKERDGFNHWMRQYMERVSSNLISSGYLSVSVPARNFYRKGVLERELNHGDSIDQRGKAYVTTLTFTAATDPGSRIDFSRVVHSEDWEILSHYPSGLQAGWSAEETIYDRGSDPVIRPGMPDLPV